MNDNIQLAIAYEEGAIRQQSKTEPTEINNINQNTKRWGPTKKCFHCEVFTQQHLKESKAMRVTCMKCGKKGHFAKCCQTRGAGSFTKSRNVAKPPSQRIQRIDEWSESEYEGSIVDEEKVVLLIEGDENGHFTMKGKINGDEFQTMVDSGSPVTIFEIDE